MSPDDFNVQTEASTTIPLLDIWRQHDVLVEVHTRFYKALFSNKYCDKAKAQMNFKVQLHIGQQVAELRFDCASFWLHSDAFSMSITYDIFLKK